MKKTAELSPATLYSGESRHAIDGSNRIMLASDWRGDGTPTRFFVMLIPPGDHLMVCPLAEFEKFLAELRADIADKTQIPQIERELNSRVRQVSLDRFGRLPLPPDFMERAGIEKQGQLVGRFSKFEIWPGDALEKSLPSRQEATTPLFNKLQSL